MSDNPVKVSPMIRGSRWSLLVAGFFYGAFHQGRLKRKEKKFRAAQAKKNVALEAKRAEEKLARAEAEKQALALLSKTA